MTPVPLEYTAYHEAGHAVIALRLGYEIGKVTIKRRYTFLGSAEIRNRTSPDDIRINLAGPLAEGLVNPNDEDIQLGSLSDWRNARRSAREFVELGFIGDREGGILIEELLQETRALVRRDRKAIAAVAEALLNRKTLSGDDIRRIVEAVR
jgi:ATP-dependent Zn protease